MSKVHSLMGTGQENEHQPSLKRKYEGDSDEMVMEGEEPMTEDDVGFNTKKYCSRQSNEEGNHQHHDLNFPLPDEKGLPCMIKVKLKE